ncbi:hypothetical protein B0T26DRAFT_239603 [Lasiosphaeria miniovina]|uniref:Uncharacterized protein n=1 Tax=Lasiosphaeria miniovina TaxID=1954250 RepID=A0AA40E569_9PEZI|nr:uncharacterized protein B0T26DRAFT_239603 [Lasiosphaeria miniovina]KAK0722898.1 hypothetical protein B0T26DRAFT_239603 [Lasiosphaeria miniovina]
MGSNKVQPAIPISGLLVTVCHTQVLVPLNQDRFIPSRFLTYLPLCSIGSCIVVLYWRSIWGRIYLFPSIIKHNDLRYQLYVSGSVLPYTLASNPLFGRCYSLELLSDMYTTSWSTRICRSWLDNQKRR